MILRRSLFLLVPLGLVGIAPADPGRTFEMSVVGPGGKPVPGAVVEFRTSPNPTAEQVRKGTFVRRGPYGSFVSADTDGRLAVELAREPDHLDLFIEIPRFGPYWAAWSAGPGGESIPDRFTAELEPGWSVGGVVLDTDGKPVEGVRIRPSIEFRKRPGLNRQLGSGASVKTDASGGWRFDSVPVSMAEVHVEIDHPDFRPLRSTIASRRLRHRAGPGADVEDRSGARALRDRHRHR